VREVADEAGIAKTTCHEILTKKLGIQRFSTTFLPSLLTGEQKQKRLEVTQDLFDHANNNES
jgi:selenophosphate synthase